MAPRRGGTRRNPLQGVFVTRRQTPGAGVGRPEGVEPGGHAPYWPSCSRAAATASSLEKAISTITEPLGPPFTRTGAENAP